MTEEFADLEKNEFSSRDRQQYVTDLFDDLAPNYDRFNRRVSFLRDEAWRRHTIETLVEQGGGVVLDLAAGTGDLARCARQRGAKQVHLFDISFQMLKQAQKKMSSAGHAGACELGSAHKLPFKDGSFNAVVSGFAMRNIFHFLDDALLEIHRILKPSGRFAILELSQPQNPVTRFAFKLHLKTVMPLIGRFTAGKVAPFNYLAETTMTFLSPSDFGKRLEAAGFLEVGWRKYLLGGIAIHYGKKADQEGRAS